MNSGWYYSNQRFVNTMSTIIVFDTETTGLPKTRGFGKYYQPTDFTKYNESRIIEIGYNVYRKCDGNLVKSVSYLIKTNKDIENSHIHGITNEMVRDKGIDFKEAMRFFEADLNSCILLVAHNLAFDIHVLLAEAYRHHSYHLANLIKSKKRFCTMKAAKTLLGLKKYPKLVQLYGDFTGKLVVQNHRAGDDTEMCAVCFFEILKRQLIV